MVQLAVIFPSHHRAGALGVLHCAKTISRRIRSPQRRIREI